nr:conserved hypothetical protein [uncultured bacterium]
MKYFSPNNENNPNGLWVRSKINSELSNDIFFQDFSHQSIEQRSSSFPKSRRTILVDVLKDQYIEWKENKVLISRIDLLLDPQSVTVTCGHQLCIGLGPLYVHSKIRETHHLAETLSHKYNRPVVPIFWMASEDHDFEEIRHWEFKNKKFSIEENIKDVAVGSISSAIVIEVLQRMKLLLGTNAPINDLLEKFYRAYNKEGTLSDATRRLVYDMHPDVICIDASDPRLKKMASNLWEDEIMNQTLYNSRDSSLWENSKRKVPVPFKRSMMFYLIDGKRSRIDFDNGKYVTNKKSWKPKELINELKSNPERVSPNALLRPIYQEHIIPNVAYLGGSGEIEYWLELIPYLRNHMKSEVRIKIRTSFAWWTKSVERKWGQISKRELNYWTTEKSFRSFLLKSLEVSEVNTFPVHEKIAPIIKNLYGNKKSIERSVNSWLQRIKKDEERMNERIRRNALKDESIYLNRFKSFRDEHHPKNILQERVWTILDLTYYFGSDPCLQYSQSLKNESNGFLWILPD